MTSTALTRRAVSVSTGVLALCLLSGGPLLGSSAFADTGLPPAPSLPPVPSVPQVPGVPSPDNVITTLDQTVKQVTGTQPGNPPSSTPPATGPSAPKAPTAAKQPAVRKPATRHAPLTAGHAAAAPVAAMPNLAGRVAFDAVTPTDIALPPATGISAVANTAPAVAPLLMPQSTQLVTPSAALTDLDKHSGSPVRAILLTLALAAAAGVGYGHLRVVRL